MTEARAPWHGTRLHVFVLENKQLDGDMGFAPTVISSTVFNKEDDHVLNL